MYAGLWRAWVRLRDGLCRALGAPLTPQARDNLSVTDRGLLLAQLCRGPAADREVAALLLASQRFRRAVPPEALYAPAAESLLVLIPHQDDALLAAGGTLLHARKQGARIHPIYVTDGRHRGAGDDLVLRREAEARAVWSRLGGDEPEFWRRPNHEFRVDEELVERCRAALRATAPEAVLVPFFLEDPVPHRKVAALLYHAAAGLPEADFQVWSYQITSIIAPNVAVEIGDVVDEKFRLNELWQSQLEVFDYLHAYRGLNAYNAVFLRPLSAVPRRPWVELFFVLPKAEYLEVVRPYFDAPEAQLFGEARA